MIKVLNIFFLSVLIFGCSNGTENRSGREKLQTGDSATQLIWSAEKEQLIESKARAGNVDAMKELYDHSLVIGDESTANRLELSLIEEGYAPAATRKSQLLFQRARRLGDRDPRKAQMLADALAFATMAAAVPRPAELHVLVNGKETVIANNGPEQLKQSIKVALERVRVVQSRQTED